jgi:hypothetical protein
MSSFLDEAPQETLMQFVNAGIDNGKSIEQVIDDAYIVGRVRTKADPFEGSVEGNVYCMVNGASRMSVLNWLRGYAS